MTRKIILEEGKPPDFVGNWTVGEALQMAQQLAAWVERLQVGQSPTPQNNEHRKTGND